MNEYIFVIVFTLIGFVVGILIGLREKAKIRDAEISGTLYLIDTEEREDPMIYVSIESFESLHGKDYVLFDVVRESHSKQRPL